MSGSDRSRHVALIGASLAAISVICGTLTYSYHMGELSGRKDAQAEGYAAAYPNDTSKQIADCWTKADTATAQECVAGAIQASHEAQRSEADLSAQRQMSDWAFWALIVGIVMAFITTIGTYLIFRQVELTRMAVEDTANATAAMLDANNITKEIGQAQTRAYLTIDSLSGGFFEEGIVFKATVKNSGQSPALSAQIMLVIVEPDGSEIEVSPFIEHQIPSASRDEMVQCYYRCSDNKRPGTLVVFVTVVYADVFLNFHKIAERFAGMPTRWKRDDFTDLTKSMHVASYLQAMEDGESDKPT